MIKKLSVIQYRKLKNLTFDFVPYVNVISGTNGTCKTSLLHIFSNSVQAVTRNRPYLRDASCLQTIGKINNSVNPKVEGLTRGDKQYNDPANGVKGTILTVEYIDGAVIPFRRHNSPNNNRFAVKPYYAPKKPKESLPFCPVIYLGLSRLLPFGEFLNDGDIEGIKKSLPLNYLQEAIDTYKQFTGLTVALTSAQKMGDIKVRSEFSSDFKGIDSNTISAGEDNLFIILTALISLKYYFESIDSQKDVESIFLIDELDATLHPSIQFKLLDLLSNYSHNYKIQVFFTTHSLSLVEYALQKKQNVLYLIDNITDVIKMDEPDIYKIKMYLHSITRDDVFQDKVIPIFTEDDEARLFLEIIFDYFTEKDRDLFSRVRSFFHMVKANIGADNLVGIFSDTYLLKTTMKSICILDGDRTNQQDYSKCIISLPGEVSPEKMIMQYSMDLYDSDSTFWHEQTIIDLNFGKVYFRDYIRPDIEGIDEKIQQLKNDNKSTKGVFRDMSKTVFSKHQRFFELLLRYWVNDSENEDYLKKFYKDLYTMFKKVAEFHGINPNEWK